MLQSLRIRLALSHTLPMLIVVPLLGLGLLYQLEQRFFLNIARELAVQGTLIADISNTGSQLWRDPTRATTLLNALQQRVPVQMEFVDAATLANAGTTVSTQPEMSVSTAAQLTVMAGTELDKSLLAQVQQGQVVWTIGTDSDSERAINVIVPITDDASNVIGAVHLTQRITDIQERINSLRILVLVTLFAGALCSLLLGLILARSIGTPLLNLSDVVAQFQPTAQPALVPETGPTEIKTLAISFNHLSHRLYELERTRTLLLSGIVHEIGRPLGAMRVAAQTIMADSSQQTAQELADGISEHIDHLQLQLDDLALLGELEIRGLTLHPERFSPKALLADLCYQFQEIAHHKAITLTCSITDDLPLINADPRRIDQILANLLHNACKYTPIGGQVRITAGITSSQRDSSLWVDVTDTGPGIVPGEEKHIFQYFYRNPQLRRFHQGMGIGLALAQQLAVAHGGKITILHIGAPGATFRLTLPIPSATTQVTPIATPLFTASGNK